MAKWKIGEPSGMGTPIWPTKDGYEILVANHYDAVAIVLAVNAHDALVEAVEAVRAIIKDGAMTGFNPLDGDWAERLFASQGLTFSAVKLAKGD